MLIGMVSFADRVRIKPTNETVRQKLAGLDGQVFGFTTPSITSVEVIGSTTDDFAINVHFDDLGESFWFAQELVELIDHAQGTTVSIEGSDTEWVRLPNGGWQERE